MRYTSAAADPAALFCGGGSNDRRPRKGRAKAAPVAGNAMAAWSNDHVVSGLFRAGCRGVQARFANIVVRSREHAVGTRHAYACAARSGRIVRRPRSRDSAGARVLADHAFADGRQRPDQAHRRRCFGGGRRQRHTRGDPRRTLQRTGAARRDFLRCGHRRRHRRQCGLRPSARISRRNLRRFQRGRNRFRRVRRPPRRSRRNVLHGPVQSVGRGHRRCARHGHDPDRRPLAAADGRRCGRGRGRFPAVRRKARYPCGSRWRVLRCGHRRRHSVGRCRLRALVRIAHRDSRRRTAGGRSRRNADRCVGRR